MRVGTLQWQMALAGRRARGGQLRSAAPGIKSNLTYAVASLSGDSDCDGMPDVYETSHSCLDVSEQDSELDADGDALTNGYEMTLGTDPCGRDSDGDGCDDGRELGGDHRDGGQRDPLSPWDFFDVPLPALSPLNPSGSRSGFISIGDVIGVVAYIGTTDGGGPNSNGEWYDTDLDGNGLKDGSEYDRSASTVINEPWRSRAPNGAVTIGDAIVGLNQIGDSCN